MTLNECRNRMAKLKTAFKQLFCWHNYGDMYQMRALKWGHIIEDQYVCSRCKKVKWKRRKIYKEGSWVK
jgi:hypothetical protein